MFISEIFNLNERLMDIAQELTKYKNREDIFISFSDYPKLGIYPGSAYNTPIGIYAYPLKEMYEDVAEKTIPFAGNRKFVVVFKATGIKDLSAGLENGYSEADWNRDFQIIKEKFFEDFKKIIIEDRLRRYKPEVDEITNLMMNVDPQKINLRIDEIISNWANKAKLQNPGGKFWNVTRNLAEQLSVLKIRNGRKSVVWTAIMRSLGYEGFTDKTGMGLIHDNEPFQAVFFSTKNIKLVEILQNVRKQEINEPLKPLDDIKTLYSLKPLYITTLYSLCNYINEDDDYYIKVNVKRVAKNIIQLLDTGNCKGVNVIDPIKFKESIKSDFSDLLISTRNFEPFLEDKNRKIIFDILEWYMNHPEIWNTNNDNQFVNTLFLNNTLPIKRFIHNPKWTKLVMLPKVMKIVAGSGILETKLKYMKEAYRDSPVTQAYINLKKKNT